jgi:hypothetical protein
VREVASMRRPEALSGEVYSARSHLMRLRSPLPPSIGKGRSRPDLSSPYERGNPGSGAILRGFGPNVHHHDALRHLPTLPFLRRPGHPRCDHDPIPVSQMRSGSTPDRSQPYLLSKHLSCRNAVKRLSHSRIVI